MTSYIETVEKVTKAKLDALNLTEGERKFMDGLIFSQLNAAENICYPVHPTEDVALELGLSKHQAAGYVSSLHKKGLITLDEDLIIQNITDNEEIYETMSQGL